MQNRLISVRLSSLGDVAMLIPVFLSFHQNYPLQRILLVTRKQYLPLFKDLEFLDLEPINTDGGEIRFLDLWTSFLKLKNERLKTVLDFHGVIRSLILGILLSFKGFKIFRIDKSRAEKRQMIKMISKKLVPLKSTFNRYVDVFHAAGYPLTLNPDLRLERKEIDKGGERWIGIAPFAKFDSKMYSLEKTNEVIRQLANADGTRLWIFGNGNKEKDWAHKYFDQSRNIELCIHRYSFEEELKIISNLDLMISMDSANGHIASNYHIPVITLWGTTHPALGFAPFSQPSSNSLFPDQKKYPFLPVSFYGKCEDKYYSRAIDSIPVEDIVEKVWSVLEISKNDTI